MSILSFLYLRTALKKSPTRRLLSTISFYDVTVEKYAAMPFEVLSLRQMLDFGRGAGVNPSKMLSSAQYVQRELPKRLARRLLDLQLLPYIVVSNPYIKSVYDAYLEAFNTLRQLPPVSTLEENAAFNRLLKEQLESHAVSLDTLATGLREVRSKQLVAPALSLDAFFDAMLASRISRRVIAEQHLSLGASDLSRIGIVGVGLNVADEVAFAAQKAKQVCLETYGTSPEVSVGGDIGATLCYVPAQLEYMLYELFKNSMRAVVERQQALGQLHYSSLPTVSARICVGDDDLTIRITDQGGGIPSHLMERVWSYGFTTIGDEAHSADNGSVSGARDSPREGLGQLGTDSGVGGMGRFRMAGLGFGLPLSRLYARYFGGDLLLQRIPGYGMDAYLMLKSLSDNFNWTEKIDSPQGLTLSY